MKAIVFTAKNEIRLTELPEPRAGPNEIVVEVKSSGICHTDYEVLKDNYGTGAFPVVPGHEYAGVIVDVARNVANFSVGDRVVVDPNFGCDACRSCNRGWAHLCEKLGAYGVTKHGGFAEFSVVNAANVHPIGNMSFLRAALAEPMGCVLNGINSVLEPWMEQALIFGAGPMGVLMGMALKSKGVKNVIFCEISEDRLELASSLAFDVVASASAELRGLYRSVDLVVEATGVPEVAENATNYIVNGGTGLFFGICPSDANIKISPFELFRRQLTLSGSHSLNHNIPQALGVIERIGTKVDKVVSHELSICEIKKLLEGSPSPNSLKVQWAGA